MNKGFGLLASILFISAIYVISSHVKKPVSEISNKTESEESFELGNRFPAGSRIEYTRKGLRETKVLETKNLKPSKVYNQSGEIESSDKGSSVSEAALSPALSSIPARRRNNADQPIPQEMQNFLNPSFNSSSSSSSLSGGAGGILITGSHVGAKNSSSTNSNTPNSNSGSTSSRGSGSVEEIRIRGAVLPLANLITSKSDLNFFSEFYAYAQPVCSQPKVGIYLTEDLLKLGASAIQEQELTAGATFSFIPSSQIDLTKPQKYSLQVSGCDTYFSRVITDFRELQNINFVSTLISFAQVSPVNVSPKDATPSAFKDLVKKLETSSSSLNSFEDIFTELNSLGMSTAFNNAFNGSLPDALKSSLPVVKSVSVPQSMDEEVSYNFSVVASHWSSEYTIGVEWFIDGASSGFGNTWAYMPAGNSNAQINVRVRVGRKHDSLNNVDTSYPYHELILIRPINNTVSPIPPNWSLTSTVASVSETPNLTLVLDTGAGLDNCNSFTALAITEVPTSPNLGDFNLICTDPGTQVVNHTLGSSNLADGNKTLYLWARDGLGEISSTPKIINFYLDQTSPVLTMTNLNALYGGGQSILLNWKMTDHTVSSTQHFDIEFFDGSTWFAIPDVAFVNGPLVEHTFTTSYSLPDSNLSAAKFRITATDLLGHSTVIESTSFNTQTAVITSSPISHNFGDIAAGSISANRTISFTNSSAWQSGICSGPSLTGHSAQFTVVSETCSGSRLAAGGSCQVIVRANPALRQAYTADVNLSCGGSLGISTVMVTGDNNPPTLGAVATQNLNEDQVHNFNLTAGADLDSDALTYQIVSSPLHGTLSNCLGGTSDLSCTYTPDQDYNGSDSFSYRAYDGQNYSSPVTVNLVIAPVNDAPNLASSQSLSVDEDTLLSFSLNAGSDIENDTLNYIVVSSPSHGTLTCVGGLSRSCTYQGNLDFNGTDSFTYKVNDGFLDSTVATVTITVNPINDAPVAASNFSITANEDEDYDFTIAAGSDVDLPAQTLTYTLVTPPAHGTLSGCIESGATTDRTCRYTPNADYNGADSFSYRVCDPYVCSSSDTVVNITVTPQNDAPVMIAHQSYTLNDNQYVDFNLNGATDIDLPAQTLSYRLTASVSQGTLSGCIDSTSWSSDISCRYTPPANFQGTVTLTYNAYDGEDESVGTSNIVFTIFDKTPSPAPSLTLHSPYITNQSSANVTNQSCADIDSLFVSLNSSAPDASDGGWVACTTTAGALSSSLTGFNGIQKIYVWSKDQYGNVSDASSVDVVYDSIAPVLVITSTNNIAGNQTATIAFTSTELHATNAEDFHIRYHNGTSWSDWTVPSSNGPHNAQVFTTTINAPNSDNTLLTFEVTYKDVTGNEGTASIQIKSDLAIPFVDSISINNGDALATNNNVQIALSAHDDTSRVSAFCLKYNDSSQPVASSSCWRNVNAPSPGITPAQIINFNNYYYQIGFTKATYTVYAWVKDEAGLISTNAAALNIDRAVIDFDPGTPPRVLAIQVTNSDAPQNPVVSSDLSIGTGGNLYIKWKAEDTEGLDPLPIKIEYSTNDTSFSPLGPDNYIANTVNGACTIDARFTGCTVLSAPTGSYFRVRVIAKDTLGTVVFVNSSALNEQGLSIIAGNTENGLDGSALSALFYNYGSAKSVSYQMKNTLAVSEDGKFFYLDPNRGLLWVDPATGVLKRFIQTTGTASGDGGVASAATLISPSAVTLDAYNHLLIWDHNLIRRVNLETMIITTIVGGGNQADPAGPVSATSFEMNGFNRTWGTFIPLPNGDIVFSSPTGTFKRYKASNQTVERFNVAGVGFSGDAGADWNSYSKLDLGLIYDTTTSHFNFMALGFYKSYVGDSYSHYAAIDPSTGNGTTTPYEGYGPHNLPMNTNTLVTGLDGKLYFLDRFRTRVHQYDHVGGVGNAIVGTGGIGSTPCAEGTPATSCAVDIDTFFVTKNSRLYFLDNGVIRTIDDSGNVISVFGQFPSYGNGELATIARLGTIRDFKMGKHGGTNDTIVVMDGFSAEFREFKIGSTINHVANVGVSWDGPWRFETDPDTGDIFVPQGGPLYQYSRTTNTYSPHMNAGAYSYSDPASDGRVESEVLLHGYSQFTFGFINKKIYLYKHHWVGYDTGCIYKAYDINDSFRQEHILGNGSCAGVGPNFGDPMGPQSFGLGNIHEIIDPADGLTKMIFNIPHHGTIFTKSASGTLEPFLSGIGGFTSFVPKIDGTGLNIFYCGGGTLYKYNRNTGISTPLTWSSPTLHCLDSRTIVYNPERNSIIFMFHQNGLHGIAEYKL